MRALDSKFVISASELAGAPPPLLPEVAFLGRSNVGKSSIINSMLERHRLARVSNTPGRTRLLNFFEVTVEVAPGIKRVLSVCDLPGYGYAKAPRDEIERWRSMVETYLRKRQSLRVAVTLIDSRHGASDLDLSLFRWLESFGRATLFVATKMDKLTKSQRRPRLTSISNQLLGTKPLGYSSTTSEGKQQLWEAILALVPAGQADGDQRSQS